MDKFLFVLASILVLVAVALVDVFDFAPTYLSEDEQRATLGAESNCKTYFVNPASICSTGTNVQNCPAVAPCGTCTGDCTNTGLESVRGTMTKVTGSQWSGFTCGFLGSTAKVFNCVSTAGTCTCTGSFVQKVNCPRFAQVTLAC